jgi:hypothetical protein
MNGEIESSWRSVGNSDSGVDLTRTSVNRIRSLAQSELSSVSLDFEGRKVLHPRTLHLSCPDLAWAGEQHD